MKSAKYAFVLPGKRVTDACHGLLIPLEYCIEMQGEVVDIDQEKTSWDSNFIRVVDPIKTHIRWSIPKNCCILKS